MSAKIMGQVWDLALPHAEIFVLLAMADHAQHDGSRVFPSQALIAWKTGYSVRQVRRIQDRLKHRKILIQEGHGYRGLHHYRIDLSTAPLKPEFVTQDTMSSEDKMSVDKKTHVNQLLRTIEDKMSVVESITEDKMSVVTTKDKMSSADICDTRADIAMSAKPSLEPSVKEENIEKAKDAFSSTELAQPDAQPVDDSPDPSGSPSKKKRIPESQQPGVLHEHTVQGILSMVIEEFHCLASPNKLNEKFWDAEIKLIHRSQVIDFEGCLNSVDSYYAANPKKCPINENSARARMKFGIDYAINQAKKSTPGRRTYGH